MDRQRSPEGSRRQRCGLTNRYAVRRLCRTAGGLGCGETGTSRQHTTKSFIHHRVESGTSDSRASKAAGSTPGEPSRLANGPSRNTGTGEPVDQRPGVDATSAFPRRRAAHFGASDTNPEGGQRDRSREWANRKASRPRGGSQQRAYYARSRTGPKGQHPGGRRPAEPRRPARAGEGPNGPRPNGLGK